VLLVAHREQRLLERPSLDAGEELRELISGGQERFLFLQTGRLPLRADVISNPLRGAAGEAGKT
jgi:hypothetical protein